MRRDHKSRMRSLCRTVFTFILKKTVEIAKFKGKGSQHLEQPELKILFNFSSLNKLSNVNIILLDTFPVSLIPFPIPLSVNKAVENIVTVKALGKCLNVLISEVKLGNISALQHDCLLQLQMICLYMKYKSCFTADHTHMSNEFCYTALRCHAHLKANN